MKTPRKLFAAVAVVIIIAGVGLARTIDYILGQNRDQVRQELQKIIGKDVSFAGLEAVWWGRPGFVVSEFRILDDSHFAATPLISAKELTLGISLWDLLFQRLVITQLTFIAPELQIIINETGALNLASLLERKNELRRFPTLRAVERRPCTAAAPRQRRAARGAPASSDINAGSGTGSSR